MSKKKKIETVVSKPHGWPKPKRRQATKRPDDPKSVLWFVNSIIEEDDHRESNLGPLLEEPSEEDAERLCLAYTGVPHDGSHPAYYEIESKPICKNAREYAKKHGFLDEFENPEDY